MLISQQEIEDCISNKLYLTIVLRTGRCYTGQFITISQPNFDEDNKIEFRDKNHKQITFKRSDISLTEKK